MKKLIAAVVTTMTFATSMAFAAIVSDSPSPEVNISGTIAYQASKATNGVISEATVKTISFNTKSLIALLNASTNVQITLTNLGLPNQIPPGSYFVFNVYNEELTITNKNGFSFPLEGAYGEDDYYDYGYLDFDINVSSYSLNTTTGAGKEQDQIQYPEFYFDDGNGNEIYNYYGTGTLNWTYGAASDGAQKASVTVSLQPSADEAEVNGNYVAAAKVMNISGSGSATISSHVGEPFSYWK